MVRTTTGRGAGEIHWRRPQGARAAADARWFTQRETPAHAGSGRPSFLDLLMPLLALSLGSILAIGIALAGLLALLSLVI